MTTDNLTIQASYGQVPDEARDIRTEVFVNEQGFQEEFDTTDHVAHHVVIYRDGASLGTGRVFLDHGTWHIGRLAVRKVHRGEHLGATILTALEEIAHRHGATSVTLNAQVRAQDFYTKQGYTAYGDTFLDEGCPHIAMRKSL